MSEEVTKATEETATPKPRAKKTVAKTVPTETEESAVITEETKTKPTKKEYKVRIDLDPNTEIPVRNGFQGTLVYVSSKTKEVFKWEEYGDEQIMTLGELKNAKNSKKKFFENNWFMIDDPEVWDYLGVTQYYKFALNLDKFEGLFKSNPDEINETLSHLNKGQKKTLAYRARQLIRDGKIDSIKVINALEDGLGIELIER